MIFLFITVYKKILVKNCTLENLLNYKIQKYYCSYLITKEQGGIILTEGNELDSTCGISDEELTKRFKESIRIDQEICKVKGLPIAGYDDELDSPYIEYPDGRRVYPNEKQTS